MMAVALLALVAWSVYSWRAKPLDPNRVVVFPVRDALGDGSGENAATLIGYALEGTAPLQGSMARICSPTRHGCSPQPLRDRPRPAARPGSTSWPRGPRARHDHRRAQAVQRRARHAGGQRRRVRSDIRFDGAQPRASRGEWNPRSPAGAGAQGGRLRPRRPKARGHRELSPGRARVPARPLCPALGPISRRGRAGQLFALAALKGATAASWLIRTDEARQLTDIALPGPRCCRLDISRWRAVEALPDGRGGFGCDGLRARDRDRFRFTDAWMPREANIISCRGAGATRSPRRFSPARRTDRNSLLLSIIWRRSRYAVERRRAPTRLRASWRASIPIRRSAFDST